MPNASLFSAWESFYVIVGSSGGALTGLQFVVMALVAEGRRKGSSEAVSAFGTPTVVHFCMVLGISGLLSAPWQDAALPAVLIGLAALYGIGYALVVTAKARRQTDYKPVLEDWIWHSALPLVAYSALLAGAISIGRDGSSGSFEIAATLLLLLFIGIHNSWDTIAYIATQMGREEE